MRHPYIESATAHSDTCFDGVRSVFPYTHFPTTTVRTEHLFAIVCVVWEAIERLEHVKLKVIVVCADGGSSYKNIF